MSGTNDLSILLFPGTILFLIIFLIIFRFYRGYKKLSSSGNSNNNISVSIDQPKRNPGVAIVLSFFIPGLGQLYNGDIWKGIKYLIFFLIGLFIFTGAFDSEMGLLSPIGLLAGAICLLIVYLSAMFQAYKSVQQKNTQIDKTKISQMKKCPYCAEMIKKEALLCRYCGQSLSTTGNDTGNANNSKAETWLIKGNSFYQSRNYEEAVKAFTVAVESDPSFSLAYFNRALVYNKIGNHRDTIADLKIAAKLGHNKARKILKSKNIAW